MSRPRGASEARDRLLDAAHARLGAGDDLTTRAVCAAAGVRAPTLYHHFGDKDGLVAAVLDRAARAFLSARASAAPTDPAQALRHLWTIWTGFALAHPALFALAMRRPEAVFEALGAADARLGDVLLALRAAGRLRVEAGVAFGAIRAALYGVAALGIDEEPVDRAAVGRLLGDALTEALITG